MDPILSHLTASTVVVYILQFLKTPGRFPWITAETKNLNRVLSGVGALITGVGIHIAGDGNADVGWHFTVAVPPLMVLLHLTWDWAQQFGLQQLVYDLVASKAGTPAAFTAQTVGGGKAGV